MEIQSSDEFDQLCGNLPVYDSNPRPKGSSIGSSQDSDDFTQWQLNRYNRTGLVRIGDILSLSLSMTKKKFRFLITIFSPFFVGFVIFLKYNLIFFACFFETLFYIISISVCFSLIYGDSPFSRLYQVFTLRSMIAFILKFFEAYLISSLYTGVISRNSMIFFRFIVYLVYSFSFFYYPCFANEGLSLNPIKSCLYSIRLSFKMIPLFNGIILFTFAIILRLLGSMTFGFTTWISFFMTGYGFLAVCGSSASSVVNQPIS